MQCTLSCIPYTHKYTPIEATKFSSFRLLVSNSLGPFPAGLGALGMSWGTGSCTLGFGSTLVANIGSLPTGVIAPSVGLRFLFSGSLKERRREKSAAKKEKHIPAMVKIEGVRKKWEKSTEEKDCSDGVNHLFTDNEKKQLSHLDLKINVQKQCSKHRV